MPTTQTDLATQIAPIGRAVPTAIPHLAALCRAFDAPCSDEAADAQATAVGRIMGVLAAHLVLGQIGEEVFWGLASLLQEATGWR